MAVNLDYPPGATQLDADELASLIPGHITTQGELNEWEQLNIVQGEAWARKQRKDSRNLVDASETRQSYIAALQAADSRDYAPLIAFARS